MLENKGVLYNIIDNDEDAIKLQKIKNSTLF
jgi:hypothetical protein